MATSAGDGFGVLGQMSGLYIHLIPMRRNPSLLRDMVCLYQWQRLVKHLTPEIVIGSTPKAGLLSMLAARWGGVPTRVYHIRGFRAEGLTGNSRLISLLAEKLSISNATVVLCDSSSLRHALVSSGCLGKDQGLVLGSGSCCGVDTEYFRPPNSSERKTARERLNLDKEHVVIGFVGRITQDKGVKELVQAIGLIRARHPNVRLLLIGPNEGGADFLSDLLKLDEVEYFGNVENVRDFYWALDIFALPSYREGFPIAPLEAQSCALPLITSDATGCIDSQPPSNAFLTVQSKDVDSLVRVITCLIEKPGLRVESGLHARQWVLDEFRSSEVVRMHNDFLYAQLNN